MQVLPHDLWNNVQLEILGNWQILRKSLSCLDLMATTQLANQKINFEIDARKWQKKVSCKAFYRRTSFS